MLNLHFKIGISKISNDVMLPVFVSGVGREML